MGVQRYARIHPEAGSGSGTNLVLVKMYDCCGIAFRRGGGPYKGWYPVNEEQAERLRRKTVVSGNPNSMRVFQIADRQEVDEISGAEARATMSPEQSRIEMSRDRQMAELQRKLSELEKIKALLDNPNVLTQLMALQKASMGAPLDETEGEIAERAARGAPRRPAGDERLLDEDDGSRRRAPETSKPAVETRPPAPAARPGQTQSKKNQGGKDPPPPRPGATTGSGGDQPAASPADPRTATGGPTAADVVAEAEADEDEEKR